MPGGSCSCHPGVTHPDRAQTASTGEGPRLPTLTSLVIQFLSNTMTQSRAASVFLITATAAHAGLPLLATPAAPMGALLLLVCGPLALAAGIRATA